MTDNFENKVAVDGPVVNEGELGSSTFSPGQVSPAGPLGLGQRWTVTRKREVALRLLRGEPVELLSRQLGVEIFRLEQWREKAIAGIDASLKERKGDPVKAEPSPSDRGVDHAGGTAGGQDGDVRPFGAAEVAAMSAATSPGTWPRHWGCPFLVLRHEIPGHRERGKARGPKPSISDEAQIAGGQRPTWRHPLGGRGTPQGLGSASGLSWHPCFPQAGAPGDAREQPALAPSLPPPWRKSPCW